MRREDFAPGIYMLHGLMTVKECRRLIAAADQLGFSHAGLAIGDDTYLASVFGQASGYWFGTGILADGAEERAEGGELIASLGKHPELAGLVDRPGDGGLGERDLHGVGRGGVEARRLVEVAGRQRLPAARGYIKNTHPIDTAFALSGSYAFSIVGHTGLGI